MEGTSLFLSNNDHSIDEMSVVYRGGAFDITITEGGHSVGWQWISKAQAKALAEFLLSIIEEE